MAQFLTPPVAIQAPNTSNSWTMVDTEENYASVISEGYLTGQQNLGHQFGAYDTIFVSYVGGAGQFTMSFNGSLITLVPVVAVGALITKDITLPAASLASAGSVVIQASSGTMQFKVRDIKVNYSAAGLSGGGGDRLVQVTDGTTVYNNAGITAALLGTPVNTVWGGSGNPLPGTVAANTATAAGASLVAKYAGGTTDFSAGSVSITATVQRVA